VTGRDAESAAEPSYGQAPAKAPRTDRMRSDLDCLSTRLRTGYGKRKSPGKGSFAWSGLFPGIYTIRAEKGS